MQYTEKKQLTSNVWLQLTVYYNMYFSCIYFVVGTYLAYYKLFEVFNLDYTQIFLLPFTWILWSIAEVARFFFAYEGNLKERVPQLAAFILFTMVQIACLLYLAFGQSLIFPIEPALALTSLIFCLFELILSRTALYALIDRQTANFLRLRQDEDEKND